MSQTKEELSGWMDRTGWRPPEVAFARLDVLVDLWVRYAPALNMTGARDRAGVLAHVQDGLETLVCAERAAELGSPHVPGLWVDVGSGGGFPGLIIAACYARRVVLLEPREKRAAFLDLAARSIESSSTVVLRARLGDATWNKNFVDGVYKPAVDEVVVCSARAVFAPAKWLEEGRNVVKARDFVIVHAPRAGSDLHPGPVVSVEGTFGRIEAFPAAEKRPRN